MEIECCCYSKGKTLRLRVPLNDFKNIWKIRLVTQINV